MREKSQPESTPELTKNGLALHWFLFDQCHITPLQTIDPSILHPRLGDRGTMPKFDV